MNFLIFQKNLGRARIETHGPQYVGVHDKMDTAIPEILKLSLRMPPRFSYVCVSGCQTVLTKTSDYSNNLTASRTYMYHVWT